MFQYFATKKIKKIWLLFCFWISIQTNVEKQKYLFPTSICQKSCLISKKTKNNRINDTIMQEWCTQSSYQNVSFQKVSFKSNIQKPIFVPKYSQRQKEFHISTQKISDYKNGKVYQIYRKKKNEKTRLPYIQECFKNQRSYIRCTEYSVHLIIIVGQWFIS